ncbi:Non-specific serine/threonine protein kinase [Bertholletia excelsa]
MTVIDNPIFQTIFAAAAGVFAVILLFVVINVCTGGKRRDSHALPRTRPRTGTVPNSDLSGDAVSMSFCGSLKYISMPELLRATRDFSPDLIIGDGSFGLVYKAYLDGGIPVALKKLSSDAFQGFREFKAEMETLGELRHPNIVTILGYCATGLDRVLIYEFIENGSLDQWLYDTLSSETDSLRPWEPLSWPTRLKIVRGVAKGLNFMHGLDSPIIHRDIKASNVLLDSEFEANIADFGLARAIEGSHSHVSTQVAGTMGYMPPEYIYGATVAKAMGDVYSFGILMLEIATGIRPNWPFKEDGKEVRLPEWAKKMVDQKREMEMLDANISREGLEEEGVKEFFRIAKLCTSEICKDRPTMEEVVDSLSKIPI